MDATPSVDADANPSMDAKPSNPSMDAKPSTEAHPSIDANPTIDANPSIDAHDANPSIDANPSADANSSFDRATAPQADEESTKDETAAPHSSAADITEEQTAAARIRDPIEVGAAVATTTAEPPAIVFTSAGPATYRGGAPLPGPCVDKPTPDVIHHQKEAEFVALAEREKDEAIRAKSEQHTKKDAKLTDRVACALHVAQKKVFAAVAEQHQKVDEYQVQQVVAENRKRLEACFPGAADTAMSTFTCEYLDGKLETHPGLLFVTSSAIRFAADDGELKEVIPHKSVCSLQTIGKPERLIVYTVDRKAYQFVGIKMGHKCMEDSSPHAAAVNWIDHMWREATQVPNPAATYFSS
eukprot:gene5459-8313_t